MSIREVSLVTSEIYHICNKSIAGFRIFNNDMDYERMMESMHFYIAETVPCKFSAYKTLKDIEIDKSKRKVDILAYCLMPTHIHLILKQNRNNGIEKFVSLISQSYSQYFNARHARKGPLWEGRFKNVLFENDEQLLHTTRYIHLNPATARLTDDPGNWVYSSYNEYMKMVPPGKRLCNFHDLLKIEPKSYRKFVLDQIDYQRQLALIKKITLD